MKILDLALHDIEIDLDRAHQAAADRLVKAIRALLSSHNLKRHKLSIEYAFDYIYLHVNGEAWYSQQRGKRGFPVVQLLDDIDAILEKCDDAVKRKITGVVL